MYWLLTYSQWTGTRHQVVNTVIEQMHPADWLAATCERDQGAQTVLLFALEISKKQAHELREAI